MSSIHIPHRERWLAVLLVAAASLPVVAQTTGSAKARKSQATVKASQPRLLQSGLDVWFSPETAFTSGIPDSQSGALAQVSDGDLLSRTGHVVRRNGDLAGRLGIMPPVPALGLDAAMVGPRGAIWFSFEETTAQIWSETLSAWLKHGDLLSETGAVVRTNEHLLQKFGRMLPVTDAGLDAVARAPNGALLFSTETDFFSQRLGVLVRHGDLLSDHGAIVVRNQDLLRGFRILDSAARPAPADYGLDAVILRSNTEIWFSTEIGFQDARLGPIGDGDLLSTAGYVVARNLDLVAAFEPVEDVSNFGLDAVAAVWPVVMGDLDMNGDVDQADLAIFQASLTKPSTSGRAANASDPSIFADMDGDGDVDLDDFGVFQRLANGPDRIAADIGE